MVSLRGKTGTGAAKVKVLNPSLYSKLSKIGPVWIANHGQKFDATTVMGPDGYRLQFTRNMKGEYYRVSCPFCGDRRHRLYVSYMFGKKDSVGRPMVFLSRCFNESCTEDPRTRQDFLDSLDSIGGESLSDATIAEGVTAESYIPMWPGKCERLDELPDDHPANVYLREERGFDPAKLARIYDLRYCRSSRFRLASHRIIIPVYHRGEFVGWQARYIGELNWKEHHDATGFTIPPKYYTLPHFPKGNFVYNLDRSRDFDCGIVMEGPTDVFSLGDGGVCSLGSSLTGHQIRLLTAAYRKPDRPIILVYDPEAFEEKHVQDLLYNEELLAHPGGFAPVILPAGTDPGSTPRKVLRNYIKEEAAKHGLKFDFRRIR